MEGTRIAVSGNGKKAVLTEDLKKERRYSDA